MPVLGIGKPHIKRPNWMKHAKEFFKIGEPFWYTPFADQNTEILIESVERQYGMPARAVCYKLCALCKWCGEDENCIDGVNYIPECHGENREDNKSVYFKEV